MPLRHRETGLIVEAPRASQYARADWAPHPAPRIAAAAVGQDPAGRRVVRVVLTPPSGSTAQGAATVETWRLGVGPA